MRLRGSEIAGIVAVVGLVVLLGLSFLPQDTSVTVDTSGEGESILEPTATPTPTATATATPTPARSPEATATEDTEDAAAASEQDDAEAGNPTLGPRRRAALTVQVVNGGAESGTAAESAATLTDASFSLLDPADAVAVRDSTVVLHGESRRLAGRTVAEVLGVEESAVALGTPDDPNWAAFGGDVDVLVVLGPALP